MQPRGRAFEFEGAIAGGLCSDSQAAAVCSDNGWRFLGARSNPSHKE